MSYRGEGINVKTWKGKRSSSPYHGILNNRNIFFSFYETLSIVIL